MTLLELVSRTRAHLALNLVLRLWCDGARADTTPGPGK